MIEILSTIGSLITLGVVVRGIYAEYKLKKERETSAKLVERLDNVSEDLIESENRYSELFKAQESLIKQRQDLTTDLLDTKEELNQCRIKLNA